MWKLPSHGELAFCVVCGFISNLSSKHCSATWVFALYTWLAYSVQSAYKPFANR